MSDVTESSVTQVADPTVDHSALARDVRATLMPGFAGYTVPGWLRDAFAAGLTSACVYGSNVRDREQLRALGLELRQAAPGALFAIDEEGGEVTRLSYLQGSPYPGAAVMGRIDDESYTEAIGRRVAHEILTAGFNLALAPDADVNSNPLNPVIGTRSFGATPELAARHVAAWTRGLEGTGAVACPKHFPGHGDTAQDSHLALPTVTASRELLTERDLPPFAAAFAAGARTVMTSHILLPNIDPSGPATFSHTILQGLLREQLGFTGVVVSDALDMAGASAEIGIPEAAVRALGAGSDLLCIGVDTTQEEFEGIVSHVVAAVAEGRLDGARVAGAAHRVRELAAAAAPAAAAAVAAVTDRSDAGTPDAPAFSPEFDPRSVVTEGELQRITDSFDGPAHATAFLAEHPAAAVLELSTEANMAVGFAPWGPFAAAAHPWPGHEGAAAAFAARPHAVLTPADSDATALAPEWLEAAQRDGVLVVGREIHRRDFAVHAIEALRARGIDCFVVELGWPAAPHADGAERDYADLATFGSSALVGTALLTLFESNDAS